MDLVLVIANIVLVCVTAAYVVLTKRMADATETAAKAAVESAEAAKNAAASTEASALLALAALPVKFRIEPLWGGSSESDEPGFLGVAVYCEASTVFVHGGRITRLFTEGSGSAALSHPLELDDEPWRIPPHPEGPRLLHIGDSVHLVMERTIPDYDYPDLTGIQAVIRYSYSKTGEIRERYVNWDGSSDVIPPEYAMLYPNQVPRKASAKDTL